MLKHPKMRCLFNTSLEMDKILFLERTFLLLNDEDCFPKTYMTKQDIKELKELMTKQSYLADYHEKIKAKDFDKKKFQREEQLLTKLDLTEYAGEEDTVEHIVFLVHGF